MGIFVVIATLCGLSSLSRIARAAEGRCSRSIQWPPPNGIALEDVDAALDAGMISMHKAIELKDQIRKERARIIQRTEEILAYGATHKKGV